MATKKTIKVDVNLYEKEAQVAALIKDIKDSGRTPTQDEMVEIKNYPAILEAVQQLEALKLRTQRADVLAFAEGLDLNSLDPFKFQDLVQAKVAYTDQDDDGTTYSITVETDLVKNKFAPNQSWANLCQQYGIPAKGNEQIKAILEAHPELPQDIVTVAEKTIYSFDEAAAARAGYYDEVRAVKPKVSVKKEEK